MIEPSHICIWPEELKSYKAIYRAKEVRCTVPGCRKKIKSVTGDFEGNYPEDWGLTDESPRYRVPSMSQAVMPNDPVLKFILDPAVRNLIFKDSSSWPYSRLSGSRVDKIGYRLIVLRCAQLGIDPPTRSEVIEWKRKL